MRLITIPLSHYCERARWALEHCGIDYAEEQHLQMLHLRHTRKHGGSTVPVLAGGGVALTDSADILAWADVRAPADRKLYPSAPDARAEIVELEKRITAPFGVETRRWAYVRFFPLKKLLLKYNGCDAPAFERFMLRATWPIAKRVATRKFDLTAETLEHGMPAITSMMDEIGERISDGRRYLVGDRFSAADLTFASLAAPILLPLQYGVPMPQPDEMPDDIAAEIRAFRDHPAGQFALRIYADERRAS